MRCDGKFSLGDVVAVVDNDPQTFVWILCEPEADNIWSAVCMSRQHSKRPRYFGMVNLNMTHIAHVQETTWGDPR